MADEDHHDVVADALASGETVAEVADRFGMTQAGCAAVFAKETRRCYDGEASRGSSGARRMETIERKFYRKAIDDLDATAAAIAIKANERRATLCGANQVQAGVSVIGAELPEPISPFARWAAEIDRALFRSNIPHVLLRANGYMQNLFRQRNSIEAGHYVQPTGDSAAAYLDVRDIADVAVAVANGSFDGKVLDLTGPEALTGAQIAAVLSEVLGRRVMFVSPDLERFRAELIQNGLPGWRVDALVEVYSAILGGRGSHLSAVRSDVEAVTGRPPCTLRQFAEDALGPRSVP
jgi:uncharacterized protein YbjT (DUF2867 family)